MMIPVIWMMFQRQAKERPWRQEHSVEVTWFILNSQYVGSLVC